MSWYRTGFTGQPEMTKRRGSGTNRLWLKVGTKERGMFLDSAPWCIYEHNPYLAGGYQRDSGFPATCPGPDSPDGCAICDIGDEPSYVGFLTWASFTSWTDQQGREHTFTKKLFPMKQKVWKILAAAAEKRGDLTGWIVECMRTEK